MLIKIFNEALDLQNTYKNYEEAIKKYDEYLIKNPKDNTAFYNKGLCLSELNRYEEAIKCYDKAIELDSSDSESYMSKGYSLSELNRYEEALKCYEKAIELKPYNSGAYHSIASCLMEFKRYEEAIDYLNKAIKYNRTSSESHKQKGDCLSELNRYEEAIKCYDEAIKLNPTLYEACISKARALKKIKRYDEAIKEYEKIPKNNSEYYKKARTNIGRLKFLKKAKKDIEFNYVNDEINKDFQDKITKLEKDRKNCVRLFIVIVVFSILIIGTSLFFNFKLFNDINISQWLKLNISMTSMVALLLWLARYFNRRTHECTHIKEEYEHKAIILKSFLSYGKKIKDLAGDNNLPLLDFVQKANTSINKSPTSPLNRKKADELPMQDIIDLARILSGQNNNKPDKS